MATHGGKRDNSGRKGLADELKGFTLAQPHVNDEDENKDPVDLLASAKVKYCS
jgi:hypothetical protein